MHNDILSQAGQHNTRNSFFNRTNNVKMRQKGKLLYIIAMLTTIKHRVQHCKAFLLLSKHKSFNCISLLAYINYHHREVFV